MKARHWVKVSRARGGADVGAAAVAVDAIGNAMEMAKHLSARGSPDLNRNCNVQSRTWIASLPTKAATHTNHL